MSTSVKQKIEIYPIVSSSSSLAPFDCSEYGLQHLHNFSQCIHSIKICVMLKAAKTALRFMFGNNVVLLTDCVALSVIIEHCMDIV